MKKRISAFIISLLFLFPAFSVYAENNDDNSKDTVYFANALITGGVYDETLAVKCNNGTFVGKNALGVNTYKGIPYAKQPVNELRWRSPVPAENDDNVFQAYFFGHSPICTDDIQYYYPQGEDCLYLNIWSNSKSNLIKKPVIVLFTPDIANPIYDGKSFVSENSKFIFVSAAYRTGIMGFADLSEITSGYDYLNSGNLGLLDCVEALSWINKNIAGFGGDPENITVIGGTDCGENVSLLPLINGAQGLFRKIIVQSNTAQFTKPKNECAAITTSFLSRLGCNDIEDLDKLPISSITENLEKNKDLRFYPERDGHVLPTDIYTAFENGAGAWCSWIIGSSSNEISPVYSGLTEKEFNKNICLLAESYQKHMTEEDKKYSERLINIGAGEEYEQKCASFITETAYHAPAMAIADSLSKNGAEVYMYYWQYASESNDIQNGRPLDKLILFGNTKSSNKNADAAVIFKTARQLFVKFAQTDVPEYNGIKWNKYDNVYRSTLIFDSKIETKFSPFSDERMLSAPLLKYYFDGDFSSITHAVPYVFKKVAIAIGIVFAASVLALAILIKLRIIKLPHLNIKEILHIWKKY